MSVVAPSRGAPGSRRDREHAVDTAAPVSGACDAGLVGYGSQRSLTRHGTCPRSLRQRRCPRLLSLEARRARQPSRPRARGGHCRSCDRRMRCGTRRSAAHRSLNCGARLNWALRTPQFTVPHRAGATGPGDFRSGVRDHRRDERATQNLLTRSCPAETGSPLELDRRLHAATWHAKARSRTARIERAEAVQARDQRDALGSLESNDPGSKTSVMRWAHRTRPRDQVIVRRAANTA